MLLGRDAEPWARRGGLFGELQVRGGPSIPPCGAEESLGSHHPNPAAELLQTELPLHLSCGSWSFRSLRAVLLLPLGWGLEPA